MAVRTRRRSPKERLKRSLPALLAVCLLVFLGGALIQIDSVSPGQIDTHATQQIRRQCGSHPTCTVRLGELVPGDWDTFYEFSPSVPRTEIDAVLRSSEIRSAPYQRVIVLLRDGSILRRQYAHIGRVQPLANEVVFAAAGPSDLHRWVVYTPQSRFLVTPCATREGGSAFGLHGGTYLLLTPAETTEQAAPRCELEEGRTLV